ncbi:LGFP repeat-containing protein [Nocardia amikacinitolerans]|uniref:LGFP repeat-containing protein n=1 Tax=Nocardia amikacinitolerans TaxID=756689 RepID=UPI00082BBF98|nr:esterase [Nocardia amikacinitolerans]MCP2316352.1 LGFP repeat-containing protein [Nocardia amikacinitolerans]
MHHARRTAGFTVALAAAALLIAGCGGDDSNESDSVLTTPTLGMTTAPMATTHTEAHGTDNPDTDDRDTADQTPDAADETRIPAQGGGEEVTVSGDIYDKYMEAGGPEGPLGAPIEAQESAPNNGKYQDFVGGTIYEPEDGEPHIVWGEIRKAWEENGGAAGELGYPVSDETDIPGGKKSEFSGGTITWVNGQITVTMK